jgi:hypothetical protein
VLDKNLPVNKVDGSAHLILWISIDLSTATALQSCRSRLFFGLQKSALPVFVADSFFWKLLLFVQQRKIFFGYSVFGGPLRFFKGLDGLPKKVKYRFSSSC